LVVAERPDRSRSGVGEAFGVSGFERNEVSETMAVTRRTVLTAAGGVGVLAAGAGVTRLAVAGAEGDRNLPSGEPLMTFASLPDFFNGDVADLSVLPNWDQGLNSVNAYWMTAIDTCLGAVAAHNPDAVFLAGDLVEGRWNLDSDNRQLFGPVDQHAHPEAIAQCKSAITKAGNVYYSFHAKLFTDRNLTVYPLIGDHEILDDRRGPLNDRWSPSGHTKGMPDNRYYLVNHCKDVWANHFTRPGGQARFDRRPRGLASEFTAYSKSFGDHLTLIAVDMFHHHKEGVRLGVFEGQLRWLRDEVRRAKARGHYVIVQGHIPTLVPTRWLHSGRLSVPERRESSFYKLLDREGVDLYLCGEVHDATMLQRGPGEPIQISHGCIFRYGFNYLVGRLYPDHQLVIDLYQVPLVKASTDKGLWSADFRKRQRTYIEYSSSPVHQGRMVSKRGRNVVERTAKLGPYHPQHDPYAYAGHTGTQMIQL
jgi:3',5'-cyclic AMP phosphodiesterase CpdA